MAYILVYGYTVLCDKFRSGHMLYMYVYAGLDKK